MKKLIILTICASLTASIIGQEIFTISEYTVEQKLNSMVNRFWSHHAAGIHFAKTNNVSPYEYGTFYGKILAASRTSSANEASFKNYAQANLNSCSLFITESDSKIVIEKESDSLLIFKVPSSVFLLNYFGTANRFGVTPEDMLEMINGSHEQISKYYGCTSKFVLEGDWIVMTIKKNK